MCDEEIKLYSDSTFYASRGCEGDNYFAFGTFSQRDSNFYLTTQKPSYHEMVELSSINRQSGVDSLPTRVFFIKNKIDTLKSLVIATNIADIDVSKLDGWIESGIFKRTLDLDTVDKNGYYNLSESDNMEFISIDMFTMFGEEAIISVNCYKTKTLTINLTVPSTLFEYDYEYHWVDMQLKPIPVSFISW